MNLPFFGQKWKHPDPQIRLEAVARLNDAAALVEMAGSDQVRDIRLAAVRRLTDSDLLVHLAKGRSDIATDALDRISDQQDILEIARQAESPEVRARAVTRVEDLQAIQRISTQDTNPVVRRMARARLTGPNTVRRLIETVLTQMAIVAEAGTDCDPRLRANLDGVCDALVADSRFRIHGLIGAVADHSGGAEAAAPSASVEAVISGATVLELLGNQNPDHAAEDTYRISSYYHIEIRRTGEDAFEVFVQQRESVAPFPVAGSSGSASGKSRSVFGGWV
jgi:hypothetical protein